jgi:aspartate/methionine/tyrosine aminotransferase
LIKVISDEVYDFLTFDRNKHTLFATIGNNYERTVSIFTSEKMLNITGWNIGWAIGPQELILKGGIVNNSIYYCFNTPG